MSDLPRELAAVAQIVGREAALDLAAALGGQDVYIPAGRNLRDDHPLVPVLGADAALKLAAALAGNRLYIPFARRALVKRLAARGRTSREIAAALGLSTATVRRYRRG